MGRSRAVRGAAGGSAAERDRMAKQYRVSGFTRLINAVMRALLRAGVPVGPFEILTVRGRTSGRPIETPLAVFFYDGNRYLIAAYGVVNWVHNLRAAGGKGTLRRGRRTEEIAAVELPPAQAAPILRVSVRSGPPGLWRPGVRAFRRFVVFPLLGVGMDSSVQEYERVATTHPVFQVRQRAVI